MVALIFAIRPASYLPDKYYILYQSYGGDILVPFAFYFIFDTAAANIAFLRSWKVKLALIFLGATASEILQSFGIYAFGVTFDYWDILMYLIGGLMAVSLDRIVLKRILKSWY